MQGFVALKILAFVTLHTAHSEAPNPRHALAQMLWWYRTQSQTQETAQPGKADSLSIIFVHSNSVDAFICNIWRNAHMGIRVY
jgi:hypothetical protein